MFHFCSIKKVKECTIAFYVDAENCFAEHYRIKRTNAGCNVCKIVLSGNIILLFVKNIILLFVKNIILLFVRMMCYIQKHAITNLCI